jgi:hypothetical protein
VQVEWRDLSALAELLEKRECLARFIGRQLKRKEIVVEPNGVALAIRPDDPGPG